MNKSLARKIYVSLSPSFAFFTFSQNLQRMRILFAVCILFVGCKQAATIHPEKKTIVETVYASGLILSEGEGRVVALSNGTIVQKLVKDGQEVKKGQLLYLIQSDAAVAQQQAASQSYQQAQNDASNRSAILKDLQYAWSSAIAKCRLDSANYRRDSILYYNSQVGTTANLERSRLNYQLSLNQRRSAEQKLTSTRNQLKLGLANAKNQLAGANQALSNYEVRANADGVVFETYKEQGETVRLGELLALSGAKEQRIIKLAVDQQDVDKIKIGQEVLLKTDITGSKILKAKVQRIYPAMNMADQTFRVDAVFSDGTEMPYVHSSVEANIVIREQKDAWVIPRAALIGADSVLVQEGSDTKALQVQTGIVTLDQAEIVSGVDGTTSLVLPKAK